jgi:hypothetical protein
MKSNTKLYLIAVVLVLFLTFSFPVACDKISEVTEESQVEIVE